MKPACKCQSYDDSHWFTNVIVQIQANVLGHYQSRVRETKLFPFPTKIFLSQTFHMKVPQAAGYKP